MKRKIIIFFLLLNFVSCTNMALLYKGERSRQYDEIIELYNHWKFEELETKIVKYGEKYKKNSKIKRIEKNINKRKSRKKALNVLKDELILDLKENRYKNIKKYVDKTVTNVLKLREFEKIDFSEFEIYFGKPVFYKNESNVLMVLVLDDESFYFDIGLGLKECQWRIIDITERR